MVVANFQQLTSNLGAKVKRVSHGGRFYLVAPASLIVPGVLNGSDGPGYYPPEENTKNVSAWDGMPIVAYHPVTENGQPTAALNEYGRIDKKVYREVGLGALRNSRGDNGRLVAEAWFDEEHVKNYDAKLFGDAKILPRLNAERAIELSTGLHVEKDIQNGSCPKTGKPYTWIARNHKPDHLAVLPDQRGACSVEDGCGVVVNAEETTVTNTEESKGKWVTLPNGVHIMVKDGEIVHGPAALKKEGPKDHNQAIKEHQARRAKEAAEKKDPPPPPSGKRYEKAPPKKYEIANEEVTENAGKYGNPQCGDTGKFMPHGSGTGKGEVHGAAKEGRHGPKAVENDCAGGLAENCSMTSQVGNSNPEGINQYTSGAKGTSEAVRGRNKKADDASDKAHAASEKADKSATKSSSKSEGHAHETRGGVSEHEAARDAHAHAAEQHMKAARATPKSEDSMPHAVTAAAHYRAADAHDRLTRNQQGDKTMDQKERTGILTKLVANCRCSDEDAKVLNTLSDSALVRVANAFPMAKQKEDPEEPDDDDETPKGGEEKKVPPQFAKNQSNKEITVNAAPTLNQEQIETALAKSMGFNDAGHMKATLNVAKKVEFRERETLLKRIAANIADEKQKELTWNTLKGKDLPELEVIANAIPAPTQNNSKANPLFPTFPNYAGASGYSDAVTNQGGNEEEDLLELPTMNWGPETVKA